MGKDIEIISGNEAACSKACKAKPECVGFVMDSLTHTSCWLKSGMVEEGKNLSTYRDSYIKVEGY